MREYADGIWRYVPAGKDIWGQPVWAAYFLGQFAGYRYRRTKAEKAQLEKVYGRGAVRTWVDCPEWCVQKRALGKKGRRETPVPGFPEREGKV